MSVPPAEVIMCSNCKCRPVAVSTLTGFDDWCSKCDESLHATSLFHERCDHDGGPRPHMHHIADTSAVCPCGWFAIRNRPLARPGKENLPVHMIITIPITDTMHIIVCLICDKVFKHHRDAMKHLKKHHTHYHAHHGGCEGSGL